MIRRKSFIKNLSITQGRHLEIINNKIQLFPDKLWKKSLNYLIKLTKFYWMGCIKRKFFKNPMCKNGFKIINHHLKK